MFDFRKAATAIGAILIVASCSSKAADEPAPPRSPPGQPQLVYLVEDVNLVMTRKMPPSLIIRARGKTRTAGWDNAELRPLQTFAPEKGIRTFTLVATGPRPDEMVAQVETPISASITLDPLPDDVKQIKVMSETNEITVDVYPQ